MNISTLRGHFAAGVAALTLVACSGSQDPVAPADAPTGEVAAEAPAAGATPLTPAVEASPTADASPAPTEAATPAPAASASPTPTPSPVASATPAAAAKAASAVVKVAAAPPASWARCAACHSAEKGAPDKLGPNLYGVYGHKMGQGSYAFSDAVKNAGLVLDDATLDKWLENPRALVPGNRMSFPGLKDPAKRAELIAYLKQQR